jgi:hypothetical protein
MTDAQSVDSLPPGEKFIVTLSASLPAKSWTPSRVTLNVPDNPDGYFIAQWPLPPVLKHLITKDLLMDAVGIVSSTSAQASSMILDMLTLCFEHCISS